MKKILIFVGVFAVVFFALFILICNNLFGIRDWIIKETGWTLSRENTNQNLENTSETEQLISKGKSAIELLGENILSKTKFCDPLRKKLDELIFPEGSYLDGYHMEINEDAAGEVYEEYHPYIYTFRVVVPEGTLEDFRSMLQKNSFNQTRRDSKINGTQYVSKSFGNYSKDQYTFTASHVYYIDEELFRSVGGIFIDIIEPDGAPFIIVTAY